MKKSNLPKSPNRKLEKQPNPHTMRGLVQFRVSTEMLQKLVEKSFIYANGNMSDYARHAALNYKPSKHDDVELHGLVRKLIAAIDSELTNIPVKNIARTLSYRNDLVLLLSVRKKVK